MVFLADVISRLNKNKFFKFISSIRLAVPVMLGLIVSVAAGTIFESLHNAEYAQMAVYGTGWFHALLCLLWINIFASMMSRYPWKKHHTGFVTTHVGILILLIGSFITGAYGLDGSLQILEGQSNNTLILPRLMVGYQFENSPTLNSVTFGKTLSEKNKSDLDFINDEIGHIMQVEKFIPFAEVEKGYSGGQDTNGPVGVSFGLKSQFFDVKQWLHSVDNPTMQLGPATLKLIIDDSPQAQSVQPPESTPSQRKTASANGQYVRIMDAKTKKELLKVSLDKFQKSFTYQGVSFKVSHVYQRAIVANNKIVESEDPSTPPNYALELTAEKNGKSLREVLYAKFPGFSLNQDGVFGLHLELLSEGIHAKISDETQLPAGHPKIVQSDNSEKSVPPDSVNETSPVQAPSMSAMMAQGNTIEFHVNRQTPDQVRIELWKQGQKVAEKIMKEGETFQTPWMGMKLFIGSINFGSQSTTNVRAVKPDSGKQLPPSAVFVKPVGYDQGFWLVQGDAKSVQVRDQNISIFFGNENFTLPYSLMLEKFTKRDYPGTETPYSYESLVKLQTDQSEHLISMNEPLKEQGYTLYQASYVLNPGQPPVTVLSVNKDPGRPVKYLGSIILALGIITFTLMRSRFYRRSSEGK
jgi:hypothetical protein